MTTATSGQVNVNAPAYVKNKGLIEWVGEMAALTKPDHIRWCDGSQAEYDELCELLVQAGVAEDHAATLAQDVVSGIQGAVVLARALNDPSLFRATLGRLTARLYTALAAA